MLLAAMTVKLATYSGRSVKTLRKFFCRASSCGRIGSVNAAHPILARWATSSNRRATASPAPARNPPMYVSSAESASDSQPDRMKAEASLRVCSSVPRIAAAMSLKLLCSSTDRKSAAPNASSSNVQSFLTRCQVADRPVPKSCAPFPAA